MERDKYLEQLLHGHREYMKNVEKSNPFITINAKLLSQEHVGNGYSTTFEVINASSGIKLNKMIEEKIYVKCRNPVLGTVISAEENRLTVSLPFLIKSTVTELLRDPNYNNRKLLESAEAFIQSGKAIPECLYKEASNRSEEREIQQPSLFFNCHLNESQQLAVSYAISSQPFKILGPPGTGKTETIIEIILQLLQRGKSVLVCGPSNTSIDNIIVRFGNTRYAQENEISFYRLGSSTKGMTHLNLEAMAERAVKFMDIEKKGIKSLDEERAFTMDRTKRKNEFIKNTRAASKLVFSTLFSSLKENHFFDACIVDEACQASELECFMGVVKARRFILAGDPYQLAPQTRSLYERVSLPEVLLKTQYRMSAKMIAFSNSYFYRNEIISPKPDSFTLNAQSSRILIDTSFFGYSESASGSSKINTDEARIIMKAVEWLRSTCGPDSTIGVIVPYSAQVLYLKENMDDGNCCTVDTVDRFQGQERDFIIVGLVRSNISEDIGFLNDKRRLNVAITRAKKGLIIVGDSENFRKDKFFAAFFAHMDENAYIVDPETFLLECEQKGVAED